MAQLSISKVLRTAETNLTAIGSLDWWKAAPSSPFFWRKANVTQLISGANLLNFTNNQDPGMAPWFNWTDGTTATTGASTNQYGNPNGDATTPKFSHVVAVGTSPIRIRVFLTDITAGSVTMHASLSDASAPAVSLLSVDDNTTFIIEAAANSAGQTVNLHFTQSGGEGKFSAVAVEAIAGNVSLPPTPTSVNATAGDGTVSVAFTAGTGAGSAEVTSFNVLLSNGTTATGTASPISVASANGSPVTAQVRAVNNVGAGSYSTASNSVTPTSGAAPPPTGSGDSTTLVGGVNVLIKGIGTGRSYANPKAFIDAFRGVDLVLTNQCVIGECHDNMTFSTVDFHSTKADATHYLELRAAAGKGYTGYGYANGIELTIPASNVVTMGYGARMTGLRLSVLGNSGLQFRQNGTGPQPDASRNRMMLNSTDSINVSAYVEPVMTDNFFLRSGGGGRMISNAWKITLRRNIFVLLAGGVVTQAVQTTYGGAYTDNVFWGIATPFFEPASVSNNFTNITPANTSGLIVNTVDAFFVNPASDFRPAAYLVGKGSANAVSTNDNLGFNRGTTPDAGAIQLTPALALPTGTITAQTTDGTSRTYTLTTTGTPTSSSITISPADPANGASSRGPVSLVLATNAASITLDDMSPGNYAQPVITLTNAGGTITVPGAVAFDIAGVGAAVTDNVAQGEATALAWVAGPTAGDLGVSTAFTVGFNGTRAGTVRITPSSPGGVFAPAFADSVNGQAVSFTFDPTTAGAHTISLANNAALANPANRTYTATAPTAPPKVLDLFLTSDGTTAVPAMYSLDYAFFDQAKPSLLTAPLLKGANGSIVNGVFHLELTGTTLAVGGIGFLVLTNSNGLPDQTPPALVFAGPVVVA